MGSTNTTYDHICQTVRRLGMSSMISCDSTRDNNVEMQTKYFQEFIFNTAILSVISRGNIDDHVRQVY